TLETRYAHEGRTIDPSFYRDLNDDYVAKFANIGFDCLLSLDEKICPRPCELVIRGNVYSDIGNRDHTQASIALMLYCLETGQPFNLAYFIIRRMYFFRDRRDKVLPYGMIITRLFKNLKANMEKHPFDERYKLVPRKMSSLKAKQPKKPPAKRTRNVGKSKRVKLTTSSCDWSNLTNIVPQTMVNYGVNCEDKAKRHNSGAKPKTFEENYYLVPYAVSSNEDTAYQRQLITRIHVMINSRSGVSLLTNTPYAQLVVNQRHVVNVIDGN
ncbi:hypothetical protein Tco_0501690, partial [Tanacetum coccineum]